MQDGRQAERDFLDDKLSGIFVEEETSIQDIAAAGWYISHSSGGVWWFRFHKQESRSQRRQSVPLWVMQLVDQAEREGARKQRAMIRAAISDEQPLIGRCVPFIPDPNKRQRTTD